MLRKKLNKKKKTNFLKRNIMKTLTKTLSVLIISLLAFSGVASAELSPSFKEAIENAKYTQLKTKYEYQLNTTISSQLEKINTKYKKSVTSIDKMVAKYNKIITRSDKLLSELRITSKKHTMVYKPVILKVKDIVNKFKAELLDEKQRILNPNEVVVKANPSLAEKTEDMKNRGIEVKIGETEEEQLENTNEAWNDTTLSKADKVTISKINNTSDLDLFLRNLKTEQWDWFEFCANFTADVYTNNALRKYAGAQSEVAQEYHDFKSIYYANAWTSHLANVNGGRIQKCVARMYTLSLKYPELNQDYAKNLYESMYNKTFTIHTETFYSKGIQPENIESYLSEHHGR